MTIQKSLSNKPVSKEDILEFINRELKPLVSEIRLWINRRDIVTVEASGEYIAVGQHGLGNVYSGAILAGAEGAIPFIHALTPDYAKAAGYDPRTHFLVTTGSDPGVTIDVATRWIVW